MFDMRKSIPVYFTPPTLNLKQDVFVIVEMWLYYYLWVNKLIHYNCHILGYTIPLPHCLTSNDRYVLSWRSCEVRTVPPWRSGRVLSHHDIDNIPNVTHIELDTLKDHPIPNDLKHTDDHHFVSYRSSDGRKYQHEGLIDLDHHRLSYSYRYKDRL